MTRLRFRNHYECPRCDECWADCWDSTCDDRCPGCNLSCSPVRSDDLEPETQLMKIQLTAASLARVQTLTRAISEVNGQIRQCRNARVTRLRQEADGLDPTKEHPLRMCQIQAWHVHGASSAVAETQPERDALFDIIEIMLRQQRDGLIAQLDAMGVVLTDQPDFGPAPAWPSQPV